MHSKSKNCKYKEINNLNKHNQIIVVIFYLLCFNCNIIYHISNQFPAFLLVKTTLRDCLIFYVYKSVVFSKLNLVNIIYCWKCVQCTAFAVISPIILLNNCLR